MPLLQRRAFTLCWLVSLLIGAAVCVLWLRSWHGGESLERVDPDRRIMVTSMYGVIVAKRWDGQFGTELRPGPDSGRAPAEAWERWNHWRRASGLFGNLQGDGWAYEPSFSNRYWWQGLGIDWRDERPKPNYKAIPLHDWVWPTWAGRVRSVMVPYWGLAALFLWMPLTVGARAGFGLVRRRRRKRAGLCATCGYDLRASPERCPECGAHGGYNG